MENDAVTIWDGEDVAALVAVTPLGNDRFVAHVNQVSTTGNLFGGQMLGQSLAAACATADGRALHSMHGYFLRPGRGRQPVEYDVERSRNGRSFSTRRVSGRQGNEIIFHMECSFHDAEPGWDHQLPMDPVTLPDALQEPAVKPETDYGLGTVVRPLKPRELLGPQEHSRRQVWIRAPSAQALTDPALHRQILAWMTDFWISGAAAAQHSGALPSPDIRIASIDHAMWFHRPANPGDWLLFDFDSPSACNGTGLSRGLVYDVAGRLVATVAQESLQRQIGAG